MFYCVICNVGVDSERQPQKNVDWQVLCTAAIHREILAFCIFEQPRGWWKICAVLVSIEGFRPHAPDETWKGTDLVGLIIYLCVRID